MTQLDGLQEKIFIDRYALKNPDTSTIKVGDTVMALISEGEHAHTQHKAVGVVTARDGDTLTLCLRDGSQAIVNRNDVTLTVETTPEQMWDRLSTAIAAVETTPELRILWADKFRSMLDEWKVVPAGRISAGAGASSELTLFNCYVIPSPKDSRGGINETLGEMTEIMARGGGVGINLSTLRPKRAIVRGVNGSSSGAVSWGGLFSYATGLIEQGGSRRGALMLMLHDWHPDVLQFITAKQTSGSITNANMSVCVSNAFMDAVKNDLPWTFKFPDTSDSRYDTEWTGDIKTWISAGYPVITYNTVQARDMWNTITESAWKSAEPGVVFMEYYNDVSNSWYFNPIICTNPCGEQGLPAWGVCNLSAINLSKFVGVDEDSGDNVVCWDSLADTVHTAVRFLDNVIDATPYHFEANRANQQNERRVGLGTMGLAEMLVRLKIRYGSPESLVFLDRLYKFIAVESYKASIDIAAVKGAFPAWDINRYLHNDVSGKTTFAGTIISEFEGEYRTKYAETGIRNVTVLTQAPTGSTGTMVGTSTGIEPYFAFEYTRSSRLGVDKQYVPIAQSWLAANTDQPLPDYFVASMELSAQDHVRVQAVIQRWVDSSISKTANAPHDFTVDDTRQLYELAYELGCKGVTIYRDGSRDVQVLSTDKTPSTETSKPAATFTKRPKVLHGVTIKTPTPFGKAYVTINKNAAGDIDEVFVKLGKTGADISVIADGLAIALTGVLSPRISALTPADRLSWITKKFHGMSGATSTGFGVNRVESLPDSIAKVLAGYLATETVLDEGYDTTPHVHTSADICTACGSGTLVREEGCYNCKSCGFTKCG